MYEYRATLDRMIDGDTVVLDIDLGFGIFWRKTCRLAGINAAELRDQPVKAVKARDRLYELIRDKDLVCRTHKDATGKYGRVLVTLLDDEGVEINRAMMDEGYATSYG